MKWSCDPKPRRQPESAIKRQVRDYLEWHGWYVVRVQQGPLAQRGISDLIAVKNGRVIWVEVKTAAGKLSPAQRAFADNIRDHGGTYVIARGIYDLAYLD
jgi:Holliday junction resolvase-like predicted endonuclease